MTQFDDVINLVTLKCISHDGEREGLSEGGLRTGVRSMTGMEVWDEWRHGSSIHALIYPHYNTL